MSQQLNFAELEARFDAIVKHYETWSKPRSDYLATNLARVNSEGFTFEDFEEGLKALESSAMSDGNPAFELYQILDDVCPAYLHASTEERETLRRMVGDRRSLSDLVRSYADHIAEQISSVDDVERLRTGLAAISIENCRTDFRDTITSLADLFVRAEEVGIDPEPHFRDVAELSDEERPLGGDTPVANMLRGFRNYSVVTERRAMGQSYRERFSSF